MEHISIKEINERLNELKDWEFTGNEITKEFLFKGFKEAMEFANKVAQQAERVNHHPDIIIKYNKVAFILTTHSAKGLTHKDFELAKVIEQLV